jgi:hypothetical protein
MGKMLIVMGTVITGLVAACVSLTASVHALQAEVSKLETRQTAADGAAAAAVQKLEKDLLARQDAFARAQQIAFEQAVRQQAATMKADVMSLPTGGVHTTRNLGGQITGGH